MPERPIGARELALLRYLADRGGATVGEAAEEYGGSRKLARSTVLTMMERLRRKGYLTRRLVGGVYTYQARSSAADLLRRAVGRFVERHLGGSVSPFVAYLSQSAQVTDEELAELEELVNKLHSTRRKGER